MREWHIEECPVPFDVVAIDNIVGAPPIVRLHKDALSPEVRAVAIFLESDSTRSL
jgi:hypothetical protein